MSSAPSRDLSGARAAHDVGNIEAMKEAHQKGVNPSKVGISISTGDENAQSGKNGGAVCGIDNLSSKILALVSGSSKDGYQAVEDHSQVGGYLKSIVFGGLDGIITTFAVVAGAAGGNLGVEVILIMGLSSLFADALSMGLGDFLSTKAANEYTLKEKAREAWEMEHYPEGEVQEMVEILEKRGVAREDAVVAMNALAKHPDFFVDFMMAFELEMEVPGEDDNPMVDGLVTFLAFGVFGCIPLLGYLLLYNVEFENGKKEDILFLISCALTALTFFVLGVLKSRFTLYSWYRSGLEVLVFGATTAAVAYGIGVTVAEITGSSAH